MINNLSTIINKIRQIIKIFELFFSQYLPNVNYKYYYYGQKNGRRYQLLCQEEAIT